jgi:hypothetical protein
VESPIHQFGRWWLAAAGMLIALASALVGALALPDPPVVQRLSAQTRWEARPFTGYRIAVRVEYSGNICSQELETAGEHIQRIITNNCRMSWLSLMTVGRLFEISERIEHPAPCYATLQTCLCHRIRVGDISYDAGLGYPVTIAYRRQVRPNLAHVEYWRRIWETHKLPRCNPADQDVRITITSLTPLPKER